VREFVEKPKGDGGWINGGFFVLSPKVLRYIDGAHTSWESDSLSRLAVGSQLMAFKHSGFWHPMDTLRDMRLLEQLWRDNRAPWKLW
jgi:glucose-1-phosphate cytidylyltransferase